MKKFPSLIAIIATFALALPSVSFAAPLMTHTTTSDFDTGVTSQTIAANNSVALAAQEFGDQSDGAVTISSTIDINANDTNADSDDNGDYADGVNFTSDTSTASGASSIIVNTATTNGLVAGDEILIINQKTISATTDPTTIAEVGKYEFKNIQSITNGTPSLKSTITFITGQTTANAYNGTVYRITVQRVPQYTNVTFDTAGQLTATAWNGTKGGVVAFRASKTVTINDTSATNEIDVGGKGYLGGAGVAYNANPGGGESYNGLAGTGGAYNGGAGNPGQGGGGGAAVDGNNSGGTGTTGSGGGGGGSGYYTAAGLSGRSAGGGGGGYGSVGLGGQRGNASSYGEDGAPGSNMVGGNGGAASSTGYGYSGGGGGGGVMGSSTALDTKIYFGSGGGAGGGAFDPTPTNGASGGNGGGIIFIAANILNVGASANLNASGNDGANGATGCMGGSGGGAGGSIVIFANTFTNSGNVIANGGTHGGGNCCGWPVYSSIGGDGGGGRTFAAYNSFLGSNPWPNYYPSTPFTLHYPTPGTFTGVMNAQRTGASWDSLSWQTTQQAGTAIAFKARSYSATQSNPDFSSCTTLGTANSGSPNSTVSLVGNNCVPSSTPANQYLYYQASFSTPSPYTTTPSLDQVDVGYSFADIRIGGILKFIGNVIFK